MEERLAIMEKALAEHTRMGLDLRRELFAKFAELTDQTRNVEMKFANMEALLDAKVVSIEGQLGGLRSHLEKAEAQLPMDGLLLRRIS